MKSPNKVIESSLKVGSDKSVDKSWDVTFWEQWSSVAKPAKERNYRSKAEINQFYKTKKDTKYFNI